MSQTVGVIGLGPMGGNVAGNLLKNDFAVVGFDLLEERMAALDDLGLVRASSATEVAEKSDVVISSMVLSARGLRVY